MASSQLQIVNLALGLLGDRALQSMAVVSLARETAERYYDSAVQMALSRGPWNVANTKAQLSLLIPTPLNEWQYAYQLPPYCCRVNRVWPDSDYDIYADQLYSNHGELAIDFNRRHPYPELEDILPPHLERYFAHELLVLIANPLTSDDAKVKASEDMRIRALAEAQSIDAQQRPNRVFRHSPFVNARRGPLRIIR